MHLPPHLQLCRQTHYVNVVQCLLRAVSHLSPLPILPLDVLGAAGALYNAWHDMLPIIEYQLMHCK